MSNLEIYNPARINRKTLSSVKTVLLEGISFINAHPFSLSFVVTTESQIIHLNRLYLGHDGPTDVIAFPLRERGYALSGEVYLCSRQIKRNSLLYNTSFEWELCFSAVHGLLHIAGYKDYKNSDREKMWNLQKKILTKAGIKQ